MDLHVKIFGYIIVVEERSVGVDGYQFSGGSPHTSTMALMNAQVGLSIKHMDKNIC